MMIHFVYINHYAYQLYDLTYINYFMDFIIQRHKEWYAKWTKDIILPINSIESLFSFQKLWCNLWLGFPESYPTSVAGYAGRITTVCLPLSYMLSLNSTKYWENLFRNPMWPLGFAESDTVICFENCSLLYTLPK